MLILQSMYSKIENIFLSGHYKDVLLQFLFAVIQEICLATEHSQIHLENTSM